MAHILIMPRQGNTVESCIITNWRAEEGDSITEEAAICDVETDKASFEVPAGATGTVLKLLYEQGDDVPVLQPIAVIGNPGENWEAQLKTMLPDKTSSEAPITQNIPQTTIPQSSEPQPDNSPSSPHSPLPTPQRGIAAPLPSPRARNLAARESIPLPPEGSGPGGRIIERDVIAALRGHAPLSVAAKAAHPGAIPPEGSGIGGRVTVSDLAAATGKGDRGTHFSDGKSVIPMKGIRKLIAGRMRQSLAESAQFTLNMPAQASKLREFRSGVKSQESLAQALGISKITINDLILFAVSRTLPRFTYMNAHCSGDTI
ncbi:MAG: 2-oxo acid dehydrogenase subunit E2, partial [Treponema sp.]|nr:2-oxo acid dehydrogenase subunit E2 [Treponema sp.]